ncbi:hypothetical protein ALC62_01144, partial [Cyphomyrmex costatus]
CLENVNATLSLLLFLGFLINKRKCMLNPMRSCRFLGFMFNIDYFSSSIPRDKRRENLLWWRNVLTNPAQLNVIRSGHFALEIFTDASLTGWEAVCGKARIHGFCMVRYLAFLYPHTSLAASKGISLDEIRTAGWSETSTTFARFYNRSIINDSAFQAAILEM